MNVLVACEFSGVVREAFRARGHNAWSCDLLPSLDNSRFHIQGDVFKNDYFSLSEFDLMIAHPPCTFLCNSGTRWLYKDGAIDMDRWEKMVEARHFFLDLWEADIPKICIENPVPHGHAGLPKYTQTIQPYQFGHGETKRTCLWLKNLPPLEATNLVEGREPRIHRMSPGPNRGLLRSVTYRGIAEAMAQQWG